MPKSYWRQLNINYLFITLIKSAFSSVIAIVLMDIWKVKYEKLLEQFNDIQVAYDAKCDELEMLRAVAGDNADILILIACS